MLSQSTSPRLWSLFQYWLGGTVDKRKLALRHYQGQTHVLEVGCSAGNLAPAFVRYPGVRYTGIDIDPTVIAHARRVFRRWSHFAFRAEDIRRTDLPPEHFDYVLVAGVLHHMSDTDCRGVLTAAARLMQPGGAMVVSEPLLPERADPWLVRQFIRVEQGEHVRPGAALTGLLAGAGELRLVQAEQALVAATPVGWPLVARFGVYVLRKG